jgi:hypothetical protein
MSCDLEAKLPKVFAQRVAQSTGVVVAEAQLHHVSLYAVRRYWPISSAWARTWPRIERSICTRAAPGFKCSAGP